MPDCRAKSYSFQDQPGSAGELALETSDHHSHEKCPTTAITQDELTSTGSKEPSATPLAKSVRHEMGWKCLTLGLEVPDIRALDPQKIATD